MSDLQTFLNFLSKQIFHFPNFPTTFFSHLIHFLCFSPSKRCSTTAQTNLFVSFILKILRFSPFFATLFHCSSSKFTITTAQFPFYNCKLHFTTAEIGISCTLKYALPSNFLKSVCTQYFLCTAFYQHSSIFRTPCMKYVQTDFLKENLCAPSFIEI